MEPWRLSRQGPIALNFVSSSTTYVEAWATITVRLRHRTSLRFQVKTRPRASGLVGGSSRSSLHLRPSTKQQHNSTKHLPLFRNTHDKLLHDYQELTPLHTPPVQHSKTWLLRYVRATIASDSVHAAFTSRPQRLSTRSSM